MTKEERIKKEHDRLSALFADLDENELQTAAGLIRSAAFLAVSLEDLEAEINANGYIDSYTNGTNQSGVKISAAVQTYNSMVGKYTTIITKLLKIVPAVPRPIDTYYLKSNQERKKECERQLREEKFLEALSKGIVKQDDYREFMEKGEGFNYE